MRDRSDRKRDEVGGGGVEMIYSHVSILTIGLGGRCNGEGNSGWGHY